MYMYDLCMLLISLLQQNINIQHLWLLQICPELQVNEMHALYDKHHKGSSFLKSQQNTYNSLKYEVIRKWHIVIQ